jgi:hypothetical protein
MSDMSGVMKIDPDAIYTLKAAQEAVGFGETFMRREIKQKRLVARRMGKRVLRIKGKDLQAWFEDWATTTENMDSCEPETDGKPSGPEKTVSERALASVTRV